MPKKAPLPSAILRLAERSGGWFGLDCRTGSGCDGELRPSRCTPAARRSCAFVPRTNPNWHERPWFLISFLLQQLLLTRTCTCRDMRGVAWQTWVHDHVTLIAAWISCGMNQALHFNMQLHVPAMSCCSTGQRRKGKAAVKLSRAGGFCAAGCAQSQRPVDSDCGTEMLNDCFLSKACHSHHHASGQLEKQLHAQKGPKCKLQEVLGPAASATDLL